MEIFGYSLLAVKGYWNEVVNSASLQSVSMSLTRDSVKHTELIRNDYKGYQNAKLLTVE